MSKSDLTPEALYMRLGQLVASMPNFDSLTDETWRWLGNAVALVEAMGNMADTATLSVAVQMRGHLNNTLSLDAQQKIKAIVYSALARAELKAPASAQGTFIPAGNVHDAYLAVSNVLGEAITDVLIVDAYADEKLTTDYALLTPKGVTIRLLTDATKHKATLKPANERWQQQYGPKRPLEVRISPTGVLHDRLIVVDGKTAWTLCQSFNDLAVKSPTTIIRTPADVATDKISAYEVLWQTAMPL